MEREIFLFSIFTLKLKFDSINQRGFDFFYLPLTAQEWVSNLKSRYNFEVHSRCHHCTSPVRPINFWWKQFC